jgi:hypothetical protein
LAVDDPDGGSTRLHESEQRLVAQPMGDGSSMEVEEPGLVVVMEKLGPRVGPTADGDARPAQRWREVSDGVVAVLVQADAAAVDRELLAEDAERSRREQVTRLVGGRNRRGRCGRRGSLTFSGRCECSTPTRPAGQGSPSELRCPVA